MVPVFYFLYPETKGRSLEEMDLIFAETSAWKPWQCVKVAATMPYFHERVDTESIKEEKPAIDHHSNNMVLHDEK